MPALLISGQIGDQTMEVRCTDTDLDGPEPVTNWLLETLGVTPYSLDAMRTLAPRLTRLFGATLQVEEVEDTPELDPEGIPPPDVPLPEEPAPEPAEEPAAHAVPE